MIKPFESFLFGAVVALVAGSAARAGDYGFDGAVSREVLESYLARSITFSDLLTEKGDFDDNMRMLTRVGAKFIGRSVFRWGGEADLPELFVQTARNSRRVHDLDPDMVLQACLFEIVSVQVERVAVPGWALEAFGMSLEERNFVEMGPRA